jgi:hypothetical protein
MTGVPRDLPSSYDGYVIAIPKGSKERAAFQHRLNKRMLFRAPETGPDRFWEPHFRFKSGESNRTGRGLTGGGTGLWRDRKLPGKGIGIKNTDLIKSIIY